jgi:dihydroneopterin aldolase
MAVLNARPTEAGMDIIFLRGLQIETIIGIYDWEREIRQTVVFDLEMATDIRRAAETDDIVHALDYKAVSKRLIEFVEGSQFFLVETLAEKVAAILLNEFSIPWVRVTLNKRGAIRGASDVGVLIERGAMPADA